MKQNRILLTVIFFVCSFIVYGQDSTNTFTNVQASEQTNQELKSDDPKQEKEAFPIEDILSIIVLFGGVSAAVYGFMQGLHYFSDKKRREQEEYLTTFNILVSNLSTDNKTAQLSSAILLRRYLHGARTCAYLKDETIKVISSMSKTFPTGILQKTLVDGLALVKDLSGRDFSKTNLQDAYLGVKEDTILMNKTDLFLADLSYALLQNIVGHEIIFYRSVLLGTQIKDCDFTNANFVGATLTNVSFKNVILKGANFSDAYNIPEEIKSKLVDGIYPDEAPITAKHSSLEKNIFFSMPGKVEKDKEFITNEYKRILENKGYNVIYYNRDVYPSYGQFNRVKEAINRSAGMIAFGIKQINIHSATYRPNTDEQVEWINKWLSTPWSDIEVGMGLMKGIPILLVTDPEITYGVFDHQLTECYVSNISTNYDCKRMEQNEQFMEWLSKL